MLNLGNKLEACNNITQLELVTKEYGEFVWTCKYCGTDLEIIHYTNASQENDLNHLIHFCQCTAIEPFNFPELDLMGCEVGTCCYFIRKNNQNYRFIGEKGLDAAKEIL